MSFFQIFLAVAALWLALEIVRWIGLQAWIGKELWSAYYLCRKKFKR